jgi:hypothetical protein
MGIEIRAGIHTGECELLDADIGGIAVHIAARICGRAGEILVRAPSRIWSSALAPAFGSRQHRVGGVPAAATPGGRSPRPTGGIRRGGTGVNTHPRPSHRYAPLGPRGGGDRQADTVGSARDGPSRPYRSQLNTLGYERE